MPHTGGKAAFFQALGFDHDNWQAMAEALRKLALIAEVTKRVESHHGWKYVVDGSMEIAGKRSHSVRTIWIVERGLDAPRLVTAYPHEQ
ncbi:MAG: hypothetical protein HYR72_11260 [Deltaproteobacteria bacterium]|nr:hypothetical protein [Deltaproteobacteria bacterium]MBI3388283.1 hypothetical protein [Deltaproteobacteria bacterium]